MSTMPQLPPEREEAHRQIAQQAAALLGGWLEGNGLKAEQARLSKSDIKIHPIPAGITVTLVPETARRQIAGSHPQGTVLAHDGDVQVQATGAIPTLLEGEDLQKALLQAFEKMPGRGFGMKETTVPAGAAHKEYAVISACLKCNGTAMIGCALCHASGMENCMTCRGEGATPCQFCFGLGMTQDAKGGRAPCHNCQATGRIPCIACRGARTVTCNACHGQRQIGCTECAQTGHQTNVYHVTYKAQCHFEAMWKDVDPDARSAAEALGLKELATAHHADIIWELPYVRDGRLIIACTAFLPLAAAEFSIVGKIYPATVAGLNGSIVRIDPVLDPIVKPGISALMKLSKGPMAVQALIDTACKFRLIRQALSGLAHSSKRTVYQALAKEYPLVLSDKYARATVTYGHQALLAITARPRYKGLAAGTLLSAVPAAIYTHTPLRQTLLAGSLARHSGLFDVIVWLLGWAAAVLMIKFMAAAAFRKLLPQNVQVGKAALPPAGLQGFGAGATTALAWLIVAATATAKPDWVQHLLAAFGIRT